MNELLISLGLVFQIGGVGSLPEVECQPLAVIVTPEGPRLGLFCTVPLPPEGPSPNEDRDRPVFPIRPVLPGLEPGPGRSI